MSVKKNTQLYDSPTNLYGRKTPDLYCPVYGIVSHGAIIGGVQILADHNQGYKPYMIFTNMHVYVLHTMQLFKRVYFHTQTAVDAGDITPSHML